MTGIKPLSTKVEVRTCFGEGCQTGNQWDNFMYDKVLITKMFTKKMHYQKTYDKDTGSYYHMDVVTGRY